MTVRHPAKYTDSFIPVFAEILKGTRNVLDPMAGVGKLVEIQDYDYDGEIWLNEIEPEWAMQSINKHRDGVFVIVGDAANMVYTDGYFDAICTSPTYGNRMADHHNAQDGSKRNTYTHTLGRTLTEGNTGVMQFGDAYKRKHEAIWRECKRVLRPGGLFVLNISDHIRKGEIVPVTAWHVEALQSLGFELTEHRKYDTPRLRYGTNREKRVSYESIVVMRSNKTEVS